MSLRIKIIFISALLVFGILNYLIYSNEQLKQHGKTMLLELAPVNSYALKDDSMSLRYVLEPIISKQYGVVISINTKGMGSFERVYKGEKLDENEVRMPYSVRDDNVYIAPNEFNFLPKEHLKYYKKSQYAMFKYDNFGNYLLIGLADKSGAEIIPPLIADKESESNRFNWHENKLRDDKQYEPLMEYGKIMLLPIIPLDPKGYQLPTLTKFKYDIDPKVTKALIQDYVLQGQAVLVLDAQNIGRFERLHMGEKIGKNEVIISYYMNDGNILFDPHDDIFIKYNTFLFQTGHAQYYKDARYAVFKYDDAGNKILANLADRLGIIIEPKKENESKKDNEISPQENTAH